MPGHQENKDDKDVSKMRDGEDPVDKTHPPRLPRSDGQHRSTSQTIPTLEGAQTQGSVNTEQRALDLKKDTANFFTKTLGPFEKSPFSKLELVMPVVRKRVTASEISPTDSGYSTMHSAKSSLSSLTSMTVNEGGEDRISFAVTMEDVMAHLRSPLCTWTFSEKEAITSTFFEHSIVAIDPKTGKSNFKAVFKFLSGMNSEKMETIQSLLDDGERSFASLARAWWLYYTECLNAQASLVAQEEECKEKLAKERVKFDDSVSRTVTAMLETSSLKKQVDDLLKEFGQLRDADAKQLAEKMNETRQQVDALQGERNRYVDKINLLQKQLNVSKDMTKALNELCDLLKVQAKDGSALFEQYRILSEDQIKDLNGTITAERLATDKKVAEEKLILAKALAAEKKEREVLSKQFADLTAQVTKTAADVVLLQDQNTKLTNLAHNTAEEVITLKEEKAELSADLAEVRQLAIGDKTVIGVVQLRAVLDQIVLDIYKIAELHPGRSRFIDAFCKAAKLFQTTPRSHLNKLLLGYADIFKVENWKKAYSLIHSRGCRLRALANKLAHTPPSRHLVLKEIIDLSCPTEDLDIARLCVEAYIGYKTEPERAAVQFNIEADMDAWREKKELDDADLPQLDKILARMMRARK